MTAYIVVKACKTDPVPQRILVRDGEYYHPQFFRWMLLPEEWQAEASEALARVARTFTRDSHLAALADDATAQE